MKRNTEKLGHQAPRPYKIDWFSRIEINGDFAYCQSHNFVYSPNVENEKLYNGQACYYTDGRYFDGRWNSYNRATLIWSRKYEYSLKSCIRRVLKCKNIPVGTIVEFQKGWYIPNKKVDNSFLFKVRKENKFEPDYQINLPKYSAQFSTCEFSQKLTDALRANGFIVGVETNTNFLTNMFNSAIAATGKTDFKDARIEGEVAVAYGHGKKIGFSSYDNDLFGYSYGCDNILWDRFGEFDKWSRCLEIPKTDSIEEIVKLLITPNEILDEDDE